MKKLTNKITAFIRDENGSDAVEMVYSTAVMLVFILVAITIMSYVFSFNQVHMATRRICRDIEISGKVPAQSTMDTQFKSYLTSPNYQRGSHDVFVTDETGASRISNTKINLTEVFVVTGSCEYIIKLVNPGNYTGYTVTLPITTSVHGMSEVYFS